MAQIQSEFSAIINQFADAIVARVRQNLGAIFSNEACGSKSIEPSMLAIGSKIFFHILGDKICVYVTTNNTFFIQMLSRYFSGNSYFAVTIHICLYGHKCSKGKMPLRS